MKLRITQHNAEFLAGQAAVNQAIKKVWQQVPSEVYPDQEQGFLTVETQDGSLSYRFDEEPIVDIRKRKKIKVTEVVEGGAEVVELISNQGAEISIKGQLIDEETHLYPEQKVKELDRVFERNTLLKAYSQKLNALGINDIYIIDVDYPSIEGFADTQPFTITARSTRSPEISLVLE